MRWQAPTPVRMAHVRDYRKGALRRAHSPYTRSLACLLILRQPSSLGAAATAAARGGGVALAEGDDAAVGLGELLVRRRVDDAEEVGRAEAGAREHEDGLLLQQELRERGVVRDLGSGVEALRQHLHHHVHGAARLDQREPGRPPQLLHLGREGKGGRQAAGRRMARWEKERKREGGVSRLRVFARISRWKRKKTKVAIPKGRK